MATTLIELVREIEKRPELYLGNDLSLARLAAFINGWTIGIGGIRSNQASYLLSEFTSFVAEKFELSPGYGWERILTLVSEKGSSDLAFAFKLFREFAEQQSS